MEEVKRWEAERDSARCDQRKARWTKPKMLAIEKATPKPKIADFEEESEGDKGMEGEDKDEDEADEVIGNSDGGFSD
ncbi:hypothetical protein CVT25_011259 [Psilocybe cyanescens]|uniref:Uncharacterized protein n=1 Tax=Psilocybe cyanescens TaxID=93625 RepID=A0A409X127_PSICY|nr:hypothetical protein CVT25_011259 [Psilocybe cyanescens]